MCVCADMYVYKRMKLLCQVRELQHQPVHHHSWDSLQSTHKLRVKMKAVGVGLYGLLSYEYYHIVSLASAHPCSSAHPPILTVLWFLEVVCVTTHHAKFLRSESEVGQLSSYTKLQSF